MPDPSTPPIVFSVVPPAESPASDLIDAMVAEMRELYDVTGHVGVPLELAEMAPPGGAFVVGTVGDDPVAGGGLRTIAEGVGEVKRMYVHPDWRGCGVGRRLLEAIETEARRLGLVRLRLDTGPAQPGARHLYESAGYAAIGNYNANPHAAFWGEKPLT